MWLYILIYYCNILQVYWNKYRKIVTKKNFEIWKFAEESHAFFYALWSTCVGALKKRHY